MPSHTCGYIHARTRTPILTHRDLTTHTSHTHACRFAPALHPACAADHSPAAADPAAAPPPPAWPPAAVPYRPACAAAHTVRAASADLSVALLTAAGCASAPSTRAAASVSCTLALARQPGEQARKSGEWYRYIWEAVRGVEDWYGGGQAGDGVCNDSVLCWASACQRSTLPHGACLQQCFHAQAPLFMVSWLACCDRGIIHQSVQQPFSQAQRPPDTHLPV